MSHTNSTAHYELPQFLGTDKPAWLTDVNGAMSAIDTAIYSAQTKANEADSKATQNTSDITSQGNQISTLSGKVTALETAQPLDEAQIELNKQNIATNAQNIVEIDNRLGHVDISAYGSTQTGAIKNIGDKAVNKCVTTDEETIGQPSLKAYSKGEYFIGKTDRNLYKATVGIAISDVLAVGTNCEVDTIASALWNLYNPYREVARASANQTFAQQLEYLATYYANLSAREKRIAHLEVGNAMLNSAGTDGRFYSAGGSQYGVNVSVASVYNHDWVSGNIDSQGTSAFSNASSNTDTNEMILFLA